MAVEGVYTDTEVGSVHTDTEVGSVHTDTEAGGVYIVTRLPLKGSSRTVSAYFQSGRAVELDCFPDAPDKNILGNIYVGKVKNLAENIGSAFIEIEGGAVCHFQLAEQDKYDLIFTDRGRNKNRGLAPGDEFLVQVSREAFGSKPPTVTGNLNFSGRYLVLTTGRKETGVSSKLGAAERERLRISGDALRRAFPACGVIMRTNAADASEDEIEEEFKRLRSLCERTVREGRTRTAFSPVYREPAAYAARLKSFNIGELEAVVTDDPLIYAGLESYIREWVPVLEPYLKFHKASDVSLNSVYGISKAFDGALNKRVWLKSGGYLVIEPTEALTVIDVNTGKFTGRKHKKDAILKTDLEAAGEIARQLRLRSLSGIIIVDFIDLERAEDKKALMDELRRLLRSDPVKTDLVDMTPLGLVEITRKKTREPLAGRFA